MNACALSEPVTEQGMAPVVPFKQPKNNPKPESEIDKDQIIRNLRSQNRLLMQLAQALGDVNRYYASLELGRPATDDEAFHHYVMCGGKLSFDQTHPQFG